MEQPVILDKRQISAASGSNEQGRQIAINALKQVHSEAHQVLCSLTRGGSPEVAKQSIAKLIAMAANAIAVL